MTQLQLFRDKRVRRLPPALEFAVHCAVADLIRLQLKPGWRWTHVPLGEHRDHKINPKTGKRYSPTGQRLKRMGTARHWPDLMFFHLTGRVCFLELKRRGEKPDEGQAELGDFLGSCGHWYAWVDSFEAARAQLQAWDIIR